MLLQLADQLDDEALCLSLRSTKCPACGGEKKSRHTMCFRDYRRLPGALRAALYAPLGKGYREAVLDAFRFLELDEFKVDP
jgi:hypothetical protein